jgi:hypothetical protein
MSKIPRAWEKFHQTNIKKIHNSQGIISYCHFGRGNTTRCVICGNSETSENSDKSNIYTLQTSDSVSILRGRWSMGLSNDELRVRWVKWGGRLSMWWLKRDSPKYFGMKVKWVRDEGRWSISCENHQSMKMFQVVREWLCKILILLRNAIVTKLTCLPTNFTSNNFNVLFYLLKARITHEGMKDAT